MVQPDQTGDVGGGEGQAEALAVLNAILRHHIRNHLTVISGRVQWLGRTEGEDDQAVDTILRRCEEMAHTVDKIETITETILDDTHPSRLDLSAFVQSEVECLSELYEIPIETTLPDSGPEVLADDVLSFVLRELIDNSATHGGPETTVDIRIETGPETATLIVSDDGPGLPAAVVPDPFSHSVRGPESDGDGLGLFLCHSIVSRYDGEIRITECDDGVTVRMTLPLA